MDLVKAAPANGFRVSSATLDLNHAGKPLNVTDGANVVDFANSCIRWMLNHALRHTAWSVLCQM
jgi:hypothetical protein